ncbi:MAG TPA: helix-turn-helix transcriptional regulator [Candidatus Angelobacter sp.]|nr:helix-turn-helix transcriptional regulator [Candidatus Angelobacter sp.]
MQSIPRKSRSMQVIQKTLGSRIRELRLKRGWSQEQFADICDIHRSHMGEIERGETNLTLSTMLVIAQRLETTIAALFRGIA